MYERHGLTKTPEYESWCQARKRCFSLNHKDYPNYGGRGISMCAAWRDSFLAFLADLGPRPSLQHTLERKDVNLGYGPGNCVWATVTEQNRNKRSNIRVQFGCISMTLKEACNLAGASYPSVWHWMHRKNATFFQALSDAPGALRGV